MESVESLSDLLRAISTGDRRALNDLYIRESSRLFSLALRIVRNQTTACDVLQDAFIQVWQKAGTFDPERGSAEAWLVSIVRYRALDAVRSRTREVLSDDPNLGDRPEEFDVLEAMSLRRDGARLRACLQKLDEKNRRVLMLAFVEGLSHSEVADRIGAPLGTVKAWIRRGLIALKACLDS